MGSFIDGKHCGTFVDIGLLQWAQVLTTGGGGVLLTNSKKMFDRAKHLSTTAKVNKKVSLEHDQVVTTTCPILMRPSVANSNH